MEVEIIEKKENPLLERTEVRFKVAFAGSTPKRSDVRNKVIAQLNADRELTVLDRLDADFGAQRAMGYVKVYANKKAMKIEPDYKVLRNFPKPKEEEKAAEAPPKPKEGEKAAEAPAKKEEAKKEGGE